MLPSSNNQSASSHIKENEVEAGLHKEDKRDNCSFIKTRDELLAYGNLEKNWDGYGGLPPSKELINTSVLLLNRFFEATSISPSLMLFNSGGIGFYWKSSCVNQALYIELNIDLDGSAYSYLIQHDGVFSGEEDVLINNDIPGELIDNILLTTHFSHA